MKVLTVIALCAREFNDVAYERIARDATTATNPNQANWLDWFNDAQRSVVLVRPDAGSSTESFLLVAGTKQALAAGQLRLLDVVRNMGADGLTPGKTLRLVSLADKNQINRDWHTEANGLTVREVLYDDKKDPRTFYVSPPASGKYIEMTVSKSPTDILDANVAAADMALPDVYSGPMQAWMLHRACSMAVNSPANAAKAWQYFSSFFNQLGVKIKSEMFHAASAPGQLPYPPAEQPRTYP